MNLSLILSTAVLALVAVLQAGGGAAKADKVSADPADHDVAAMMKRWQEACTPNENHAKLAQFVGTWDTETSMWMGGPGAPATKSKGTSEIKWLVQGRWLVEEAQGSMMGMPIRTFSTIGYDNFKRKYVSSVVNSMTTTVLTAEGNFDQSGKNLITYGLMDEPMTGEHDKCVRYVTRIVDADKIVFEVHDLAIGESNTRVVEIAYARRKS